MLLQRTEKCLQLREIMIVPFNHTRYGKEKKFNSGCEVFI